MSLATSWSGRIDHGNIFADAKGPTSVIVQFYNNIFWSTHEMTDWTSAAFDSGFVVGARRRIPHRP